MTLSRFIAAVLLLQGVGPAILFGVWRPGGWFLVGLAIVCALLSVGMWWERRWALVIALAYAFSQFFVFSSPWLSWRFFIIASGGFGVAPADTVLNTIIFSARSFGCRADFAFGYNPHILADYASVGHPSFLFFNVLAAPLLPFLLEALRRRFFSAAFPPGPDTARQPAAPEHGG